MINSAEKSNNRRALFILQITILVNIEFNIYWCWMGNKNLILTPYV